MSKKASQKETRNIAPETWVWIPHPQHVWVKAKVIQCTADGNLQVSAATDDTALNFQDQVVKADKPIHLCNNEDMDDISQNLDDLTQLTHLHEATVLHQLKLRYAKNLIYTFTGTVLIAINPFQRIPDLYSKETMRKFFNPAKSSKKKNDPHVFAIGAEAYSYLCQHGVAQTILISGESGAGKTESTKYVMNLLATAGTMHAEHENAYIEEQVLKSNPLLETFGNAKTLRNENSSRFGKFIEMQFSRDKLKKYDQTFVGNLIGARVQTYLLETVRVCHQLDGERSYHSFYQLCAAAKKAKQQDNIYRFPSNPDKALAPHLKPCEFDFTGFDTLENFNYLTQSSCTTLERTDDVTEFDSTVHAMQIIGISHEEQVAIFRLLEGILHLGNLSFEILDVDKESSKISETCESTLSTVLKFLELDRDLLIQALTTRSIKTKSEEFTKPLKVEEGEAYRDSLAKALYKSLFDLLVQKSNDAIGYDPNSNLFCGILDIFGFECFPVNSFEQLCINYTNERLQQFFNDFVFRCEEKQYQTEGIPWDTFDFPDNQDCVDLLENRHHGIFVMIDEEGWVPQGNDMTMCSKIKQIFKEHPRFTYQKHKLEYFAVNHFAGPVHYCTTGFLEKNQDMLSQDVTKCILESKSNFVRSLFIDHLKRGGMNICSPSGEQLQKSNRMITISSEFIKQLGNLMTFISETVPHFIRCIKPNQLSIANKFEEPSITEQLQYGGVLQVLQVSRAGYPIRMAHKQARAMLKCLLDTKTFSMITSEASLSKNIQTIMDYLDKKYKFPLSNAGIKSWAVGNSRLFLKFDTYDILMNEISSLKSYAALKIETLWRMYVKKKEYQHIRKSIIKIQAHYRRHAAYVYVCNLRRQNAATKIQTWTRKHQAMQQYRIISARFLKLQYLIRLRLYEHAMQLAKEHRSIMLIQSSWKSYHQRSLYLADRRKIIKLQLWWKRSLAKKSLRFLRSKQRDAELLQEEIVTLRTELKSISETHAQTVEQLRKLEDLIAGLEQDHQEEVKSIKQKYEVSIGKQQEQIEALANRHAAVTDTLNNMKETSVLDSKNGPSPIGSSRLARTPSPLHDKGDITTPPAKTIVTSKRQITASKSASKSRNIEEKTKERSSVKTKSAISTVTTASVESLGTNSGTLGRTVEKKASKTRSKVIKSSVDSGHVTSVRHRLSSSTRFISAEPSGVSHGKLNMKTSVCSTSTETGPSAIPYRSSVFVHLNKPALTKTLFSYHDHRAQVTPLNLFIFGYSIAWELFLNNSSSEKSYTIERCENELSCPCMAIFRLTLHEFGTVATIGYMELHHLTSSANMARSLAHPLLDQCLKHWIKMSSKFMIIYDSADKLACENAYQWMNVVTNNASTDKNSRCYCYTYQRAEKNSAGNANKAKCPTSEASLAGKADMADKILCDLTNNATLYESISYILKIDTVPQSTEMIKQLSKTYLTAFNMSAPFGITLQSFCNGTYYNDYLKKHQKQNNVPPTSAKEISSSVLYPSLTQSSLKRSKNSDHLECIHTIKSKSGQVTCMAFGQQFLDNEYYLLAVGYFDGQVSIYNIQRTNIEKLAFQHFLENHEIAKQALILKGQQSEQQWLSSKMYILNKQFVAHEKDAVTQMMFLPNNDTYLVTTSTDMTIRVWNVVGGHMERIFKDTSYSIALIFLPSHPNYFLSSNANATMRLVDSSNGEVIQHLQHPSPVSSFTYDDKGLNCIAGSNVGHLSVMVLEFVDKSYSLKLKVQRRIATAEITSLSFISRSKLNKFTGKDDCVIASMTGNHFMIVQCVYTDDVISELLKLETVEMKPETLNLRHCISYAYQSSVVTPTGSNILQAHFARQMLTAKERDSNSMETVDLCQHEACVTTVTINAPHTLLASGDISGSVKLWRSAKPISS